MPVIDTPINASTDALDKIISNNLPILLVVYEKQLDDDLAAEMKAIAYDEAQNLLVVKIDIADNPDLVTRYNLSGTYPVILALKKGGKEAGRYPYPSTVEFNAFADYLLGLRNKLPWSPAGKKKPGHSNGNPKPVKVTDASFENDVLKSDVPVLVDLWAAWCGPCRMIAPTLEKLAGVYAGQLKIAKLNVDENRQIPMQFQVQGIPTLLLFKNGKLADKIVGAAPEPMLRQFIQKHL